MSSNTEMTKQGKAGQGTAALSGFYKLQVIFRIKTLSYMRMPSREGSDKCISIQCALLLYMKHSSSQHPGQI